MRGQELPYPGAAAHRGQAGRCGAVPRPQVRRAVVAEPERGTQVGALGEQPHPVSEVVGDGPPQLIGDQVGRRGDRVAQPRPPRAAATSEAVVDQQGQVVVVRAELAVVQRLGVIGVGARGQERAGQGIGPRVGGLPALATAQRTGQRGEGRGQAVPQIAGVRVGAVIEQHAGSPDDRVRADVGLVPGVREIQDRLPSERPSLGGGQRRIRGQQGGKRVHVGRGRGRVHRGAGESRVRGEQCGGAPPAGRVVVLAVPQTGQQQELVRVRGRRLDLVRGTAVVLDDLDVPLERGPRRETVAAGDDQLRAGQ